MARVLKGKELTQAKRDHTRSKTQGPREFIIGVVRMAANDGKDFPKRRAENVKCVFVNLVLGLRSKQKDRHSVEDLACILAFVAIYGRAPKLKEVSDLQLETAIKYFEENYPDDIFGPEK